MNIVNYMRPGSTTSDCDLSEEGHWYAVHTWPRHEKKIDACLRNEGVVSYLPLVNQLHRWSDRRKLVDLPLFPCYMFVHIVPTPEKRVGVLKAPGVIGFVGKHGEGTPIPDNEVEQVRTVLSEKIPLSPYPFLNVGQRVRIRGGSLDGVEGIWLGQSNGRLIISVELVQQSLAISVEGYDVEPV